MKKIWCKISIGSNRRLWFWLSEWGMMDLSADWSMCQRRGRVPHGRRRSPSRTVITYSNWQHLSGSLAPANCWPIRSWPFSWVTMLVRNISQCSAGRTYGVAQRDEVIVAASTNSVTCRVLPVDSGVWQPPGPLSYILHGSWCSPKSTDAPISTYH